MAVKVRSCKHFFQVIYYTPYRRSSSIKGCITSKGVFRQKSSSIKARLPSKVVFHQRSYTIEGRLPLLGHFYFVQRHVPSNNVQLVFCQRSSSVKGRLPSKVVFCQRFSSVKSCLPSNVVFHRGRLPLLGHFNFWVLVLSVA